MIKKEDFNGCVTRPAGGQLDNCVLCTRRGESFLDIGRAMVGILMLASTGQLPESSLSVSGMEVSGMWSIVLALCASYGAPAEDVMHVLLTMTPKLTPSPLINSKELGVVDVVVKELSVLHDDNDEDCGSYGRALESAIGKMKSLRSKVIYAFLSPTHSHFADSVVGVAGEYLVLIQSKDVRIALPPKDFWLDLYKMGHRGAESVAARIFDFLEERYTKSNARLVIVPSLPFPSCSVSDTNPVTELIEFLNDHSQGGDKLFLEQPLRPKQMKQDSEPTKHAAFTDIVRLVNTYFAEGSLRKQLEKRIAEEHDPFAAVQKAFQYPPRERTVFVLQCPAAVDVNAIRDSLTENAGTAAVGWKATLWAQNIAIMDMGTVGDEDSQSRSRSQRQQQAIVPKFAVPIIRRRTFTSLLPGEWNQQF